MQQIIKEMQGLKESINTATIEAATSEGRLSSSLDRLKKEFKQASLEGAKKVVTKNELTLNTLKEEIIKRFKSLRENYEF